MTSRIRKAQDERDKGFTLIELLVVIVIIGILAAIAIPVFLNQRKKGVDASLKSDLKSAATALETETTHGAWGPHVAGTTMDAALGKDFKESPGNTVTVSGDSANGYVISAYNDGASTAVDAASALTYNSEAGGLQ